MKSLKYVNFCVLSAVAGLVLLSAGCSNKDAGPSAATIAANKKAALAKDQAFLASPAAVAEAEQTTRSQAAINQKAEVAGAIEQANNDPKTPPDVLHGFQQNLAALNHQNAAK